ncbi:MAG: glutamate-5-semialdehyde dehydrogenase [Patescibacteria group bacterium]|jgi:glutamate-5-semialdehyde dehydrogenase
MHKHLIQQLIKARTASRILNIISTKQKNAVLVTLANLLQKNTNKILKANQKDLAILPADYAMRDRLLLTPERIKQLSVSLLAVTKLTDPIGEVLDTTKRPSGITVTRVRVPFGVIGVIYEARPNVTIEVASLCLKTGNAVLLKGSKDAFCTNTILVKLIQQSLQLHNLNKYSVQLIDPYDRQLTTDLLQAHGYVDVVIPRGSNRLIQYVREQATVPVIETGAGVCHTYVEKTANVNQAVQIIVNAKTRRYTVCNTLDCLVLDKAITKKLLPKLALVLQKYQIQIFADKFSYQILKKYYPTSLLNKVNPDKHYGQEFLAPKLAIKTVINYQPAIAFIQKHTSGHSEAIITHNKKLANDFINNIDAATIYVNTSTAFTDGFEFGLGAEIGISTQKLHARGPMGLTALTTYKWLVTSQGKIRAT